MNNVKSCLSCQKRKWQGQGTVPLGSFPAVSQPLERFDVDLIEIIPSYEGNKYILTVVDHFSKYVSAYSLLNKLVKLSLKRCFVLFVITAVREKLLVTA